MKTVKDLGRAIKQKHPQYRDLSDEQVGRVIKEKYPTQYADIEDLYQELSNTTKGYQTSGYISSWWGSKASAQRNKYFAELNQETAHILAAIDTRMYAFDRMERVEELSRQQQVNNISQLRAASEYGVSPTTYQQLVLIKAQFQGDYELKKLELSYLLKMKEIELDYGLSMSRMGHEAEYELRQMEREYDLREREYDLEGKKFDIWARLAELKLTSELKLNEHRELQMIDFHIKELTAKLQKEMVGFKQMLPHREYQELNDILRDTNNQYYSLKSSANTAGEKAELQRLKTQITSLKKKLQEFE
jgi:hypothetical protein